MKISKSLLTVFLGCLFSLEAMAFITVIDVYETDGSVTTVSSENEYPIEAMRSKSLMYRGIPSEAEALFLSIAGKKLADGSILESEINEETGTISVIVGANGFFGTEYHYFVIKKS